VAIFFSLLSQFASAHYGAKSRFVTPTIADRGINASVIDRENHRARRNPLAREGMS
jgi:hypothetical protein